MTTAEQETVREMVETEEPERTFEEEVSDPPPSDEEAKPEASGLFDGSVFESEGLRLPAFEGRRVNKIAVAFTGTVELNRLDPSDVALLRSLTLGKEVELRVSGVVAGRPHTIKLDEDGNLETTSAAKVKVHSIDVGEEVDG